MAEQLLEVLRMANALEKLIEDTLVRGREEGSIEGEVAGFREAVRLALLQRFGQVPPAVAAHVAAADKPALVRMLDRLSAAGSAAELLAT